MNRRYDLDWLRVIAFGLLMLFHTGMLFSSWNWHVKNLETSLWFDYVMKFLHEWRMPLLFFISGSAVSFILDRISLWKFFVARQQRLLVPLIFGILVIIPPQVYFERLYHQQLYSGFLDFYGTLFTSGSYPEGNLSWHHLWYIPYVWAYSMLLLPIFAVARTLTGGGILSALQKFLARPLTLFLIFLPSAAVELLLRPYWPGDACNLLDDWANFTHKLTFFLIGYALASAAKAYESIEKYRVKFLICALMATGLLYAIWYANFKIPGINSHTYRFVSNFNIWMWILAALGFAKRYLSFNHPVLREANQAVYPFYILHQTVIIILGFYVVRLNWNLPVKFALVVATTFGTCWAVYALAIRRWNLTRLVFGMKPLRPRVEREVANMSIVRHGIKGPSWALTGVCVPVLIVSALAGWTWTRKNGALVSGYQTAPSLSGSVLGISQKQMMAVYLPPSYDTDPTRKYPVLYFLPNFNTPLWRYTGGSFQGFRLKEAVDQVIGDQALPEMIVVAPNALHGFGGSWYQNSPLTGNWEDYIFKDVVSATDNRFRTIRAPQARAIAGHGMGGFGALSMALKHPDVFGHVYAMSPPVFDDQGLENFGLKRANWLNRWKDQVLTWNTIEDDEKEQAFRDYFRVRLNSPNRVRFFEALHLSYLAVFTFNPETPYPHFGIGGNETGAEHRFLKEAERGFGGWPEKLDNYLRLGTKLQTITLEYGDQDEYEWIRHGVEALAMKMNSLGIDHTLLVHRGGHDSTLGDRLRMAMLPEISRALAHVTQ